MTNAVSFPDDYHIMLYLIPVSQQGEKCLYSALSAALTVMSLNGYSFLEMGNVTLAEAGNPC